jgi:hypothetical protein
MQRTIRDRAIALLRAVGLNRVAARIVYRLQGFRSANQEVCEAIERAFREVRAAGVKGDYLEFGVFKGASLLHAQKLADRMDLNGMKFFGFDSFEGLPEEPGQVRQVFYKGQYECAEDSVRRWLSQGGVDWTRMALVPGFYDRSLTPDRKAELGLSRCAVAMLDCDIYSSTRVALSWIDDVLVPGSIVILDDWDAYGDDAQAQRDGQRKAMAEHRRSSQWSFEEWFHYGRGLRGGLAFRVSGPRGGAGRADV